MQRPRARAALVALALAGCRPAATTPPAAGTGPSAPAGAGEPGSAVDPGTAHPRVHGGAGEQTAIEPPWGEDDLPRIVALQPQVIEAAARHGVDPFLVDAIIWHESRFNPKAQGPGGAAGLMQLMPSTSRSLAKRLDRPHRPYDPAFNLDAGAYLLSRLLTIFDGDVRLALAGYALGHVAVQRRVAAGEPLPERTQRFIDKVTRWRDAFAHLPEGDDAPAQHR
ncbi:MAG: lytic transglycosylase domain-containing protein [Nannocystaceae bacterium]